MLSGYNALAFKIEKKSGSPDEDKSISDSSSLKPILSDFFVRHSDFHPLTFLGDSAFDSYDIYGFLKDEFHFSKALLPYNPRNESTLKEVGYNEYGYPTCPNDNSLVMKHLGITKEAVRSDRIKWGCPKMQYSMGRWHWLCKNPCSTARKGRTAYISENIRFRMFPGIRRNTQEWVRLYKIRTIQLTVIAACRINCLQYIRSLKPLIA